MSGWIGALDRTSQDKDKIERGIALMARGKLVQEPFVFDATVGQQFALSYLIGELHVEFADEGEDTIATTPKLISVGRGSKRGSQGVGRARSK